MEEALDLSFDRLLMMMMMMITYSKHNVNVSPENYTSTVFSVFSSKAFVISTVLQYCCIDGTDRVLVNVVRVSAHVQIWA